MGDAGGSRVGMTTVVWGWPKRKTKRVGRGGDSAYILEGRETSWRSYRPCITVRASTLASGGGVAAVAGGSWPVAARRARPAPRGVTISSSSISSSISGSGLGPGREARPQERKAVWYVDLRTAVASNDFLSLEKATSTSRMSRNSVRHLTPLRLSVMGRGAIG